MGSLLGSLLGLIGLGDEEFTYGTGLMDPKDPTKLLHPDWLRHATAEQLNAFTQDHLNVMTKEQVDAYQEGVANATAVYEKAVADAKEMERRANLTFPTSMTQQEIDALSPEARADYYERVQYAARPVTYNAVASEPTADRPDWQYSVSFMNGAGRLCRIGARSLDQVRNYQSTLSLAGIGSISCYHAKQVAVNGLGKLVAFRVPAQRLYTYGPRTVTNMRIITDRPGQVYRPAVRRYGFRMMF